MNWANLKERDVDMYCIITSLLHELVLVNVLQKYLNYALKM